MLERMKTLVLAGAVLVAGSGAAVEEARAQQFINVLTGGTSGVYYPLGVALSEIYAEGIEGARTQVQATKASVENLNLLQQGKGEIGFSLGDSVKAACRGQQGGGLPRAARQAARPGGDLSELHPDRRLGGLRHQDARGPQGQVAVGRCAGLGDGTQRPGDLRGGGDELR